MSHTGLKCLSIIVFYHSEDEIERCLTSFRTHSPDTDIFMFLNSPVEAAIIEKMNGFCRIVNPFKKNVGFAKAVNEGFKFAIAEHYDYVALVNPDVHFMADPIKRGIEICQLNENNCILSPLHLSSKDKLDMAFEDYITHQKSSDNVQPFQTNFVNAAFWIIPINVLKDIGGFDPLFFMYGEDSNYAFRLKLKGFRILVAPELKIFHTRNSKITRAKFFYLKRKASLYHDLIAFDRSQGAKALIGKLIDDLFRHSMGFKGFILSTMAWIQTVFRLPELLNRRKRYHAGVFLD
jgi:GT2 family glycosyltransferase